MAPAHRLPEAATAAAVYSANDKVRAFLRVVLFDRAAATAAPGGAAPLQYDSTPAR